VIPKKTNRQPTMKQPTYAFVQQWLPKSQAHGHATERQTHDCQSQKKVPHCLLYMPHRMEAHKWIEIASTRLNRFPQRDKTSHWIVDWAAVPLVVRYPVDIAGKEWFVDVPKRNWNSIK
jgi:hypothetical protein